MTTFWQGSHFSQGKTLHNDVVSHCVINGRLAPSHVNLVEKTSILGIMVEDLSTKVNWTDNHEKQVVSLVEMNVFQFSRKARKTKFIHSKIRVLIKCHNELLTNIRQSLVLKFVLEPCSSVQTPFYSHKVHEVTNQTKGGCNIGSLCGDSAGSCYQEEKTMWSSRPAIHITTWNL